MTQTTRDITYVDLFAGIGGFRCGIEAFQQKHPAFRFRCIQTADIKHGAIKTYNHNFGENNGTIDVRTVCNLPHFDLLCAGFPCQPFSTAGKRAGLHDPARGDLIYEVVRICRESQPEYILLENVSNIQHIHHGKALATIVSAFQDIGYNITCENINATQVGLAQNRKRTFIVGCRSHTVQIRVPPHAPATVRDIIDYTDTHSNLSPDFLAKLAHIPLHTLTGKSIKDKRGGTDNLHSWDIAFHGPVSERQKTVLNALVRERRKKKWAVQKGVAWKDGMPLTLADIQTFCNYPELEEDLEQLAQMGYVVREHPKKHTREQTVQDTTTEYGYNIAKGKLSFPISKILHPDQPTPTLTATDSAKLAVLVGNTIRTLNETELKRLCGFPPTFTLPKDVNKYDLFGNMVCPPVVTHVLESVLLPSAQQ